MSHKKVSGESIFSESHFSAIQSKRSSLRRSLHQRVRTLVAPLQTIDLSRKETSNREIDEEIVNDALLSSGILSSSLANYCRVSPLHHFSYNNVKLKQYALKIRQYLSGNLKNAKYSSIDCKIEILSDFKLHENHPSGVAINVSGEDETNSKVLYQGILFTWGSFIEEDRDHFTYLPLLYDSGNSKVVCGVREILQKMFDCVIMQFEFTQSELLLLSALLSSFSPEKGARLVTFDYKVPCTQLLTKLKISIEIEEMHNFWKSCFPDENAQMDELNTQKLYKVFQKHMSDHHGMDISRLELTTLNYPDVMIQSKGVIRMRDLNAAKIILKIMCEMSVILKGSVPKLSLDYD